MREGKPGGGKGPLLATEESLTLATGNGQTLFAPLEPLSVDLFQVTSSYNRQRLEPGPARTLHTGGNAGVLEADPTTATYGVRRLTPVECERLQAFPDGWTEPAGSDSARYKALGNAVTVTVPHWLFGRIMEVGE